MAEDPKWPDIRDDPADGDGGPEDHVSFGLPPTMPSAQPPLNYAQAGGAGPDGVGLPVAAGFVIGVGLYVAVAGVWWFVARADGGLSAAVLGVAGVPAVAAVLGGVLQASMRWRGVVAGVGAAVGLSILIGCAGILALCGWIRV